jgi:hypothetical protein
MDGMYTLGLRTTKPRNFPPNARREDNFFVCGGEGVLPSCQELAYTASNDKITHELERSGCNLI